MKIKVKAHRRKGKKVKAHKRKIKKKIFFDEYLGPDKDEEFRSKSWDEMNESARRKFAEQRERDLNDIRQADREAVEEHLRRSGW